MFIRTRGRPKGLAAVELAVLLPLLMFLFVIATDYARVLYYSLTIENCARNGAQFASNIFNDQTANSNSQMPSGYNNSIPQAAIADGANLNPPLTTANATVSNGTDANNNATVTVTVTYTFQTITNYPGIPSTVNLSRSVTMRYAPQNN